ncbi:MAG: hypothetical protein ABSH32_08840, partial [Bryobacteraceae bacterium]
VPAPALDRLSACLQGCRDESRHGTHERVRHIIEPHVRNADSQSGRPSFADFAFGKRLNGRFPDLNRR